MDAIALLCTLHADGPATARRLRRSGCSSLPALLALEPERLATILEAPPAVARRFQREAKSLNERLGNGWGEREEEGSAIVAPIAVPPAETAQIQGREQRILSEVLANWRRKDAEDTVAATDVAGACSFEPPLASLAREIPESPDRLSPGIVDGLDADACARLAAAGVAALDDLARIDAVAISRATALGFTRVSRWRALADRARRMRGTSSARGELVRARDAGTTPVSDHAPLAEPPAVALAARRARVPKFSPSEAPFEATAALDLLLVCTGAPGAIHATADGDGPAGPFA